MVDGTPSGALSYTIMAKGRDANAGCLGLLFVVMLPFLWLHDKCSGGEERRARERQEEEALRVELLRDQQQNAHIAALQEATRVAKLEREKLEARAAQKAGLARWKPYQRVQAVQKCVTDFCPEGVPDVKLVIEAAKNDSERKQLQALHDRLERAQERANAPLRCCDGSNSPSCTCGRANRRGCCSHHGGICGCSADN